MKVIVTGSAGFIGYYVSKKLLEKGHKVIGIDNLENEDSLGNKAQRVDLLKVYPNFEFIKLNILNEGLPTILKEQSVDYFIHLAAKDFYYNKEEKLSEFIENNVLGTVKMAELAKKLSVKKFIYASTFSVYGKTKKQKFTEKKLLPKPISPHGASKIATEQILQFMSSFYNVPTVILRIFTVYGPDMPTNTAIYHYIEKSLKGEELKLHFDNTAQTRDFIYIDDVVESILATLNKRIKYQTINIATGKSHTFKEIYDKVSQILGQEPLKVMHTNKERLQQLVVDYVEADTSRAKKILKYEPKTTLDEGLEKTVKWYQAHPEELGKSPYSK